MYRLRFKARAIWIIELDLFFCIIKRNAKDMSAAIEKKMSAHISKK